MLYESSRTRRAYARPPGRANDPAMTPPDQPAPIDYRSADGPPPLSGPAVAALVIGLLALPLALAVVGLLPGVLAIGLGYIGRRQARQGHRGGTLAAAGMVTGGVAVVLSFAVFPLWLWGLTTARQQALAVTCLSQIRQLEQAVVMYGADNNGRLPPDLAAVTPIVGQLQCPLSRHEAAAAVRKKVNSNYVYAPPPDLRLTRVTNPSAEPLIIEPVGVHGDVGHVGFADGHVEAVPAAAFRQMVADLEAAGRLPGGVTAADLAPTAGP